MDEFGTYLLSGSVAGLCVDMSLYPLDTIKTRLQSADGFYKSGGFRGIYSGLGSVAVGSMPGGAIFFTMYELVKAISASAGQQNYLFATHMCAASCGEMAACLVRVPVEVVKQRTMVFQQKSSWASLTNTIQHEGYRGLYRGYLSTVMREVPFSMLQFPLWEFFKNTWADKKGSAPDPWQSALCGFMAGGISAAATTPLDVAKTRIMLAQKGSDVARGNITLVLRQIYRDQGTAGLFAGILPRCLWISIGGAIFLGAYDKAKVTFKEMLISKSS